MVVKSPGSRPSHKAWIARRSSLPERVLGNTVTKRTRAGRATAPSRSSTTFMIAPSSLSAASGVAARLASLSTTNAMAT